MANANARQRFDELEKKWASWEALGMDLQKRLNLARLPHHIECVDISNISGTNAVGSLVRYQHGHPEKNGYRRYKIKQVEGPDDYAMMREVLTRRFRESNPDSNFPEMLLVDGGKGQLSVAESILKEYNLFTEIVN